jgi:hypothetical protein
MLMAGLIITAVEKIGELVRIFHAAAHSMIPRDSLHSSRATAIPRDSLRSSRATAIPRDSLRSS